MNSLIMSNQVIFSPESSLVAFALWDRAKVLYGFVNFPIMTLEASSVCEAFFIAGRYRAYERTAMSIFVPPARILALTKHL